MLGSPLYPRSDELQNAEPSLKCYLWTCLYFKNAKHPERHVDVDDDKVGAGAGGCTSDTGQTSESVQPRFRQLPSTSAMCFNPGLTTISATASKVAAVGASSPRQVNSNDSTDPRGP